jgi:hypothetical protein
MTKMTRAAIDYCADLLSERRNEKFLLSLFRRPKGEWAGVRSLCGETATPLPPEKGPGSDLVVVWLDEPNDLDGYCTILFFSPTELWSNAAIYNRVLLLESRST